MSESAFLLHRSLSRYVTYSWCLVGHPLRGQTNRTKVDWVEHWGQRSKWLHGLSPDDLVTRMGFRLSCLIRHLFFWWQINRVRVWIVDACYCFMPVSSVMCPVSSFQGRSGTYLQPLLNHTMHINDFKPGPFYIIPSFIFSSKYMLIVNYLWPYKMF